MTRHILPRWGVALLCATALVPAASAQGPADPVGQITPTGSTVEGGVAVKIGRDASGRPVCYVRDEQSGGYRLDVGLAAWGAFVRLQAPEPPGIRRPGSVRAYAGTEKLENGRTTGRFDVVARYGGAVSYFPFDGDSRGQTLVAVDDPTGFLVMVAAARNGFIVIEASEGGAERDWFHVYRFDRNAAVALRACTERRLAGQK